MSFSPLVIKVIRLLREGKWAKRLLLSIGLGFAASLASAFILNQLVGEKDIEIEYIETYIPEVDVSASLLNLYPAATTRDLTLEFEFEHPPIRFHVEPSLVEASCALSGRKFSMALADTQYGWQGGAISLYFRSNGRNEIVDVANLDKRICATRLAGVSWRNSHPLKISTTATKVFLGVLLALTLISTGRWWK